MIWRQGFLKWNWEAIHRRPEIVDTVWSVWAYVPFSRILDFHNISLTKRFLKVEEGCAQVRNPEHCVCNHRALPTWVFESNFWIWQVNVPGIFFTHLSHSCKVWAFCFPSCPGHLSLPPDYSLKWEWERRETNLLQVQNGENRASPWEGWTVMLMFEDSLGGWSEVIGSMAGDLVDPELQGTCTQSSYMC